MPEKEASKKITIWSIFSITVIVIVGLGFLNCIGKEANDGPGNFTFLPTLSSYHIFTGKPDNMEPGKGFHVFQSATTLFTDYAHKQRLIWLPKGRRITKMDAGLPEFPDSTILVKTFFYYNDERDTSKGKRKIETRLLIKSKSKWHMGTFVWNASQTEATHQKKVQVLLWNESTQ